MQLTSFSRLQPILRRLRLILFANSIWHQLLLKDPGGIFFITIKMTDKTVKVILRWHILICLFQLIFVNMFDLCMQRDATSFVEIPGKNPFGT